MVGKSSPPEAPPAPATASRKVELLRHRPDFVRCARGFRRVTPSLTVEVAAPLEAHAHPKTVRAGFTATKRSIGGAVERNRAKRRLRAAAAAQLPLLGLPGHDYVLVARPGTLTQPFSAILEDLAASLEFARAKLTRNPEP
jgi:ribonuclease P protein component